MRYDSELFLLEYSIASVTNWQIRDKSKTANVKILKILLLLIQFDRQAIRVGKKGEFPIRKRIDADGLRLNPQLV